MGEPKEKLNDVEFWQGIYKGLIYAGYIILGALAKIAFDSRIKPLTKREVMVKFILSVFAGILAWRLCAVTNRMEFGQVIVPVATLLGEGIVTYIMTNWRKWIGKLMPRLLNPDKNNETKDNY